MEILSNNFPFLVNLLGVVTLAHLADFTVSLWMMGIKHNIELRAKYPEIAHMMP